jgi:hypothetical protein
MNTQPRILRVGEEPPPLHRVEPSERARPATTRATRPKEKRSSQGRFLSINAFLVVTMARLGRAELAVWLLLWRDTKPDGLARTSQADLAKRAGCNPRTVRRALATLQQDGLVSIICQGGLNRGLSVYRVEPLGPTAHAR